MCKHSNLWKGLSQLSFHGRWNEIRLWLSWLQFLKGRSHDNRHQAASYALEEWKSFYLSVPLGYGTPSWALDLHGSHALACCCKTFFLRRLSFPPNSIVVFKMSFPQLVKQDKNYLSWKTMITFHF